ncbi:YqgQ family protein [Calditerricola satsumensis]|uniref:DUF910 family protein n=1 Tax=Calditerricola satsumensis TaxID=373054 RepID=A0A8J3B3E3_9BACI|nr:YqgQ family protein [Calditerricola satsumensis]GGJ92651.1 hypothetical protein GCM10007043_02910 [Calditerricola satsumensis]
MWPQHAIRNLADVRAFLRQFGVYVYTGDPEGDVDLMRDEVRELYEAKLIDRDTFAALSRVLAEAARERAQAARVLPLGRTTREEQREEGEA